MRGKVSALHSRRENINRAKVVGTKIFREKGQIPEHSFTPDINEGEKMY